MSPRTWRRWWRLVTSRGAAASAGLLLVCCALLPPSPAPAPLLSAATFPHVSPRALAHKLADFSTHLILYPHLEEWTVEEESSNYSSWQYAVRYSCGPRCSGRARVTAADEVAGGGVRHGPPDKYRVTVSHRACTAPALLPWPTSCEEWETETEIFEDVSSGGAALRERARASCGVLRRLWSACAPAGPRSCHGDLRAQRELHLQRLRALLDNTLV